MDIKMAESTDNSTETNCGHGPELTELNELQLTLVGGGNAIVTLG
jgi:hypothetical protein